MAEVIGMTAGELIFALKRMPLDQQVVVEISPKGGLVPVDGIRRGRDGRPVLVLWRPYGKR